jgi:hypothetical protein
MMHSAKLPFQSEIMPRADAGVPVEMPKSSALEKRILQIGIAGG